MSTFLTRRRFFSLLAAPAIVSVADIMPVKALAALMEPEIDVLIYTHREYALGFLVTLEEQQRAMAVYWAAPEKLHGRFAPSA